MEDEYQHRFRDEEGNPDDLYTEKEALALAKEEGIDFVDTYQIEGSDETYSTLKAAKTKAKGKNIITIRSRKV